MNSGCFEGMFIHRDVVSEIGLPDPRFFIYWDDSVYGWLASLRTTAVIVNEFVLRRTREIRQWDMGIRHLNASSDAYRYYIMRNRGYMKHYFAQHGAYRPVRFWLGSVLTFLKELVRLVFVERKVRGTSNLFRGIRDGRRIAKDAAWTPMPPLAAPAADQPAL
jgi:GT2 family glycosyltransferase